MPPKRPSKRRQADEDDQSLARVKKMGKNKREITYDTYDEALDGGVDMEEKGERYKDGDKAHRFYEKAVELYKKAYDFHQSYDAAYNQARALYTLSTSFLLPPTSLTTLLDSIKLYRLAMTLTNSPLLLMDAGFNLAQACASLADMMEEYEGDSKSADVIELRKEAKTVLKQVLEGQDEYIHATVPDGAADETGQKAMEDEETGEDDSQGMEVDEAVEAEAVEDETTATYETHLPTLSSIIDTALSIIEIHLSLWESTTPSQTPSEEEQTAVRQVLHRATQVCPSGRQAELDLAEIKILLIIDGIVWDLYKGEAKVGTGVEKSLEGASKALEALLKSLEVFPPDEENVRADILTTLADTHSSTAYRLISLSPQLPPGPSPLAQSVWYNLGQAITYLTTALNLPTTPTTPKEFKPSVLLGLSRASLARARLADINETAKRNSVQLVENATAYAARAGETLGWSFIRLGLASNTSTALPYPIGWDGELLARNIALQQLRICYYASHTELLAGASEGMKEKFEAGAKNLVERLKKIPDVSRRLKGGDVERWIGDIEGDEGGISEGERSWWNEVTAALA